jgi:hypothetical protein
VGAAQPGGLQIIGPRLKVLKVRWHGHGSIQ